METNDEFFPRRSPFPFFLFLCATTNSWPITNERWWLIWHQHIVWSISHTVKDLDFFAGLVVYFEDLYLLMHSIIIEHQLKQEECRGIHRIVFWLVWFSHSHLFEEHLIYLVFVLWLKDVWIKKPPVCPESYLSQNYQDWIKHQLKILEVLLKQVL